MNPRPLPRPLPLLLPLLLLACAAPAGDSKASSGPPEPAPGPGPPSDPAPGSPAPPPRVLPAPWTDAFVVRAILLADSITIEGPVGLLEHCVMTLDDNLFERTERPTADGLQLVLKPRGSGAAQPLLRAQIEAWSLAAYEEIRMDLRAGLKQVTVTARGNALWQDTDGNERRGAQLVFRGPVEMAPGPAVPPPAESPSEGR